MNQLKSVYMRGPMGTVVRLTFYGTNKKLKEAQYWLDTQVMTDMLPLIPMDTGVFIHNIQSRSQALAGTGWVCAYVPPMGRYLYEGKVMVDSETGKGARRMVLKTGEVIYRHRKGATLMPTDRPLSYSRYGAVPHWYEEARKQHFNQWVDGVRKILKGG